MGQIWVNGKFFDSRNPKADKWKPEPKPDRILWDLCECGEPLYEGDSVGMHGDHAHVVCYACWMTGEFLDHHVDCVGLKLPDATLSQ